MLPLKSIVFSVLVVAVVCKSAHDFPTGFQFGAGTSAYQIEGGWNASDKGENIWDRYTHDNPYLIADTSNGDVACDSYNQWQRDVEVAAELGLDFYRFSISWARVLPAGFAHYISEDGKSYYNNLIDGLLDKGIEPLVTMYHWELPQRIQDLGGWTNPLIVDWFGEYARVLFTLYSDRVKTWLTINEPIAICDLGYSSLMNIAPNIVDVEIAKYLCSKHVVLAHAKAWRIYDKEFRARDKGQVSFANHMLWFEPHSPGDEELAELALQLLFCRFAHPIFSKEGGWPPAIEKIFAEISAEEGYPTSRLPAFTEEEIELARGAFDYMGVNQYTSLLARRPYPGEHVGDFPLEGSVELNMMVDVHPDWKPTAAGILWVCGQTNNHPEGLRRSMAWIKERYGDVKILITENGYATDTKDLDDVDRIDFYKVYLEQLLLAIKEDGVDVVGYSAWSMMDTFEWADGYKTMMGLYSVDFTDPARPRTARRSAHYYASVIKARSLDVEGY